MSREEYVDYRITCGYSRPEAEESADYYYYEEVNEDNEF